MAGTDVFAVMPTGGGKSLCYQLPACLKGGTAIVVSPLISLMKDQVDAANANGIGAASLNSSLGEEEKSRIYRSIRQGGIQLLYISPERFNAPGFLDYLKSLDISFFAIDEAHCISEWGHDFRPDYLSLAAIAREFPGVAIAAFTATATPKVADDIVSRLGLRKPHLTRASFNRPNLTYRIAPKNDIDRQVLDFLAERGDEAGIIYRTTRKNVEATAAMLVKNGIDARAYHAGLSDTQRARAQEDFRHDRCQVVVATIAFGMGIDKPNVRYVVHADLPKNLEGYYQETGRAGRDGEPAQCVLFHSMADIAQLLRFNAGIEDNTARKAAQAQLNRMIAFTRTDGCRRCALLGYFGEEWPEENCGSCDICLGEAEREDATVPAQKVLSAMARTGGRFGAVHLADILVGADTAKIRQNSHNQLPTFGVGKDKDKSYWRAVIEAVTAKGLAEIADSQYPTPSVTAEGWKVLKGEATFAMLKQAEKRGRTKRTTASQTSQPYSQGLFARLRKERARLAEAKGLPPYMVFADKTLQDMARILPRSDEDMLNVSGVGRHKLKTYGEPFLTAIASYLAEHPEEGHRPAPPPVAKPSTPLKPRPPAPEPEEKKPSDTELATWQLFSDGLSLHEIAQKRKLKTETIVTHMESLHEFGYTFQPDQIMPQEKLREITTLFEKSGGTLLKPVVEASKGSVNYVDARIARLFLHRNTNDL